MSTPFYRIHAFTAPGLSGNPAGVCPLDEWLPDDRMQWLAAENALSETAFFVPSGDGYDLRWFTPAMEVDLCGHATLASAWVVFERLSPERQSVAFSTRSGRLEVERDGELLRMNFPSQPPAPVDEPAGLADALGGTSPVLVLATDQHLVAVLTNERTVRELRPVMRAIQRLPIPYVIVTAEGGADDVDVVSRFFAPEAGVPEDPVTGSAHCVLTPLWAETLGQAKLCARQVSERGGEIRCELAGDRVLLSGRATPYLEGTLLA